MDALAKDRRQDARQSYLELSDEELAPWSVVSEMHDWSSILLGNGASIAVWHPFSYRSLFEQACALPDGQGLSTSDQRLFDALDTTNFESVLAGLRTARDINHAIGLTTDPLDSHYESVRSALSAAVHAVHVDWVDVPTETLQEIKSELLHYDTVFSTNYDLLVYWAAMEDGPSIPDYFWSRPLVFDPLNTEVWNKATKVLFLHGGLHLYQLTTGETFKRTAEPGRNLLELFGTPLREDPGAVPLFVSEGQPSAKLSSIRRSDYLSFALKQFATDGGPLVVFGHSLSAQDRHLIDALMKRATRAPVAVSIYGTEPDYVLARKAEIRAQLPGWDLSFFDASSHPLGSPAFQAG